MIKKKKAKIPFVIWQHGQSFRREQKKTKKHQRLKEFHVIEFQIIFNEDVGYEKILQPVKKTIEKFVGRCRLVPQKRKPKYAKWTRDIELSSTGMELGSISMRTDFEGACVLEIAIGTDRLLLNSKDL